MVSFKHMTKNVLIILNYIIDVVPIIILLHPFASIYTDTHTHTYIYIYILLRRKYFYS